MPELNTAASAAKTTKAIRQGQATQLKEKKAQLEDRWYRIKRLTTQENKSVYWLPQETPTTMESKVDALLAAIEAKEGLIGKEILPLSLQEVQTELARLLKQVELSLKGQTIQ